MLPQKLLRKFDPRGLKWLLALFFVALAVPTAALIWQANSQLKWEAFYQHRVMAEELTSRIDRNLVERINAAEARAFGDYSFLVVSGDPAANLLQRSPLAEFPVVQDLPGVIGYFQVDADGTFSTPLLPPADRAATLGISALELSARLELAHRIQSVLADNRLIRERPAALARGVSTETAFEEARPLAAGKERSDSPLASADKDDANAAAPGAGTLPQNEAQTAGKMAKRKDEYSQQVFDQLNTLVAAPGESAAGLASPGRESESGTRQLQNALGKVTDLKLDATLQKKGESLERKVAADEIVAANETRKSNAASRSRRMEQTALPESVKPATPALAEAADNVAIVGSSRITTFASEVDPFEFSLLDSGHLVLFRKVWRNGERLIQGLLLDTTTFLDDAIESQFRETSLSGMSDLVVGYQDDVIEVIRGGQAGRYPAGSAELTGTLLYRNRLSAPLDRLELIFSINRLPPGPGAKLLLWITLVLGIVFLTGFYVLYRLGLGQINLARQQQDFVSAVSHELKTPLTSIRMYGEMLKEGWVSDEKKQQYYHYIHDESERLTRLISNVLQLSNITRSEPRFDLRPQTTGELLNQIESKIGSQIERAGFTLKIVRDDISDRVRVNLDEDCFIQIIINLVDNAIKFSRNAENRTIELACRKTSGQLVTFSVRDFGPGIAKDQMKKIFEMFYRSESELTRETVGTGIGLAIVHQLVVAMNGKVDVVNKNPGAEFRLVFGVANR